MIPRNELLKIVAEDLCYLKRDWNESVEDSDIRRGSTVLRQLLVQNELQRAWRMVGFESQPIITASTLDFILSKTPLDKTTSATAGGARYQGTELRGAIMVNYAKTESEMKSDYQDDVPSASMKLQDFISAPCIVINGELINRHTLIKYVANKLGGAH